MADSDHDLMCRALVRFGAVAAHYPIAMHAPWALKTRSNHSALRALAARSHAVAAHGWSRNASARRVGCAQEHRKALMRRPPIQEVRLLEYQGQQDGSGAAADSDASSTSARCLIPS